MNWLIIIFALWTYPIITGILYWWTRKRLNIRKKILKISLILSVIALFGLLTKISTTLSLIDWLIITSFYFNISFFLWIITYKKNILIKIIGIILFFLIFGLGYFSSTVGAIGIGFVTAEYSTDSEKWLDNGIIYKECILGNAIADYRGKRVEIYKTISWFPVIEWRKMHKDYYDIITYMKPLIVNYKQEENKIYLKTSINCGPDNKLETWADTLKLE